MALEIEKAFDVPEPPEEVWDFLTSPERVTECLPGGKLLETVDERTFRGEMGIRLGPIGATFEGEIRFDRLDEAAFEVEMSGEGKDRDGAGSARMTMKSKLVRLDGGGTRVNVTQSVSLSGKLASFGRSGVVQSVADFMFGRFTDCVERRLAEA